MKRCKKPTAAKIAIAKNMMDQGKKAIHMYRENPALGTFKTLQNLVTRLKKDPNYSGYRRASHNAPVRTSANVARVKTEILKSRKSVTNSARKLSQKLKIPKTTVSRILKRDLGTRSRRPFKTFEMSEKQKQKRSEWAQNMEKALSGKANPFGKIDLGRILFSDEKLFSIKQKGSNSQNHKLWVFDNDDPALRIQETEAFSKGVMVSLAVSQCGVGRLIFVAEGEKICGDSYKKTLLQEFAPDIKMKMKKHENPNNWWWQQDLAPPHGAKSAQEVLKNKAIIPNLLPWFPKGADLSPLDFGIWGFTSEKLSEYRERTPIASESDLRAALLEIHAEIPQSLVNKSVDSFKKRVTMLREAEGGHFEHLLKKKKRE